MDPINILMILVIIAIPVLVVLLILQSRKNRQRVVVTSDRYNTLAVVAFVLAFFVSVAAVVLGHIAHSQIRRTGERGYGLATAALVLGYLGIVGGAIGIFYALSQLQPYM